MTAIEQIISSLRKGFSEPYLNSRDSKVLTETINMVERFLPIEKQDLQRAFDSGKDSKVFMVETEFEIQYDYLETFDQFYNELKGE